MTLKLFKSGIHTTMGLAAVIAVGAASGVFDSNDQPVAVQPDAKNTMASREVTTSSVETKRSQKSLDTKHSPAASASVVEQTGKKDIATPGTNRPQFDVLRVEKDGAVVVAGNAVPNSQVDIVKPDGSIIGQAQTGEQGDFALALKDILTPGNHVLGLRSMDADGVKLRSVQTGIVRIPEAEGDVLAMVSQDGEVSRILMKPVAFEPQQESVSKRESLSPTPPTTRSEVSNTPNPSKQLTTKKERTTVQHPVLVEAVEVEGRHVFVAGAVMQGELVRVYLDNVSIGTTRGTRDNRFLLSKKFALKPGLHAVRVDVINEKTGGVWSRAEVGLQHDLPEEMLAVETDKSIGFTANSGDQPAGIKVAGLDLNLRDSVIDDEVLPKLSLDAPAIPQPSIEAGGLLEKEPESTAEKLLYAHAFKSAISNAAAAQGGAKFIYTGRAIIIKPGDSLWRISQHTYGDGMRYTTIFNANRNQIRDPNLIYVGQIVKIPEKVVQ